ncbi:MAG: penicillin-binding protein 2 [Alphaproteobacteria bacterium]|nr:MAG: penicillin-binding protein 2 [Alphaproteobacteria bacterium]
MKRTHVFGYTPQPVTPSFSQRGINDLHNRVIVILAALTFIMICLMIRVGMFGLGGSDAGGSSSALPYGAVAKKRPDIYDANGELLATTVSTVSLAGRAIAPDEADELAQKLQNIFPKKSLVRLRAALARGPGFVWLARNITPRQHAAILKLGNPKLELVNDTQRFYPHGRLFSHVLGLTNLDNRGISGIEHTLNGSHFHNVSAVRLGLDIRFQQAAYEELTKGIAEFGANAGNVIIMDAKTGLIKAMISLPDYNPHSSKERTPVNMFNRNTSGVYEMGSTLKIFNTAMSLETGAATLSSRYKTGAGLKIGRFRITDFHGKSEWMTVPQVFLKSSNVGSSLMAIDAGIAKQKDFFEKLGFLKALSYELPEKGNPLVPLHWSETSLSTIAYGYGISVTPLHLAKGVATIVNNGKEVTPSFIIASQPHLGQPVISKRVSAQMRALMRLAVTEGTCRKANVDSYVVIGKTGTANKRVGRNYQKNNVDAAFVGAVGSSINDIRYVVVVMLDNPQRLAKTFGFNNAGWNTAPIAARIIAKIAPLAGITPNRQETSSRHTEALMRQVKYIPVGNH